MQIFWWIPGALCVVTGVVEGIQYLVKRHRMMNPYIGHLNYRDNRVGRYYSTRH
jgi:hypothetical protein